MTTCGVRVLACAALVMVASDARAQTVTGGILPQGATTWTAQGSPYLLTTDVIVPNGATLTIADGVTVEAAPSDTAAANLGIDPQHIELVVQNGGNLIVGGSPQAPVVFEVQPGGPATSRWWGIRFDAGSQQGAGGLFPAAASGIWNSTPPTFVAPQSVTIDGALYGVFSDTTLLVGGVTITNFACAGIWLDNGLPAARDYPGSMVDSVVLYPGASGCSDSSVSSIGDLSAPSVPMLPAGIWVTGPNEALIGNALISGVPYGAGSIADGIDVVVAGIFRGQPAEIAIFDSTIDATNHGISVSGTLPPGPEVELSASFITNVQSCPMCFAGPFTGFGSPAGPAVQSVFFTSFNSVYVNSGSSAP